MTIVDKIVFTLETVAELDFSAPKLNSKVISSVDRIHRSKCYILNQIAISRIGIQKKKKKRKMKRLINKIMKLLFGWIPIHKMNSIDLFWFKNVSFRIKKIKIARHRLFSRSENIFLKFIEFWQQISRLNYEESSECSRWCVMIQEDWPEGKI